LKGKRSQLVIPHAAGSVITGESRYPLTGITIVGESKYAAAAL